MKKFLILVLGLIWTITATSALAVNCDSEDGIVIVGNNGQRYCKSKVTMNWWSAFAWCKAQSGTLVSITDCNWNDETYLSSGKCVNFIDVTGEDGKKYSDYVWTSIAVGTDQAQVFQLASGSISLLPYYRNANNRSALCK